MIVLLLDNHERRTCLCTTINPDSMNQQIIKLKSEVVGKVIDCRYCSNISGKDIKVIVRSKGRVTPEIRICDSYFIDSWNPFVDVLDT